MYIVPVTINNYTYSQNKKSYYLFIILQFVSMSIVVIK